MKDALIDGDPSVSVKYAINHRYIQEQTYPGGPAYDLDTGLISTQSIINSFMFFQNPIWINRKNVSDNILVKIKDR